MIYFILLLTFGLRLINLKQSLWLDEAIQAWAISHFSLQDLLVKFMPSDVHPPLSYLVNFFFNQLFGNSVIVLRIPSVIFSLLTVWFVYLISRQLLPKRLSLLPAALLATSSLHTYYSQEARMYSLVIMLITASMFFLLNFIKNSQNLFLYFIFTLLAVYSHYTAWFILPTQLFITWRQKPEKLKHLLLTQLGLIMAYLPWLPTLLVQIKAGSLAASTTWGGVVGGLNLKNLALIPVKFLIGRISIASDLLYALVLALPLSVSGYLLIKARKSVFIFSWLIIPLALAIMVSFKIPILSYSRLLFILPAFYLGLSLGINNLSKKHQPLIIAFLLFVNLASTLIYLFNPKFHREDWQNLAQTLSQKNPDHYPVAIISAVKAPLEYYYSGNLVDFSNLVKFERYHQLWLIPYAQPIFYPDLDYQQTLASLGFRENFKQHFRGGVTLVKYIK